MPRVGGWAPPPAPEGVGTLADGIHERLPAPRLPALLPPPSWASNEAAAHGAPSLLALSLSLTLPRFGEMCGLLAFSPPLASAPRSQSWSGCTSSIVARPVHSHGGSTHVSFRSETKVALRVSVDGSGSPRDRGARVVARGKCSRSSTSPRAMARPKRSPRMVATVPDAHGPDAGKTERRRGCSCSDASAPVRVRVPMGESVRYPCSWGSSTPGRPWTPRR